MTITTTTAITTTPTTMTMTTTASPLGALRLCARGGRLVGVYFEAHRPPPRIPADALEQGDDPVLVQTRRELAEYFAGTRTRFEVPIAIDHGTPFERAVWSGLTTIAPGETISYAELARRIGRPRAVRAVGAANGRNPLSIVLPCHRVVGAGGALTGYAGGVDRKAWLLDHEARAAGPAEHAR